METSPVAAVSLEVKARAGGPSQRPRALPIYITVDDSGITVRLPFQQTTRKLNIFSRDILVIGEFCPTLYARIVTVTDYQVVGSLVVRAGRGVSLNNFFYYINCPFENEEGK